MLAHKQANRENRPTGLCFFGGFFVFFSMHGAATVLVLAFLILLEGIYMHGKSDVCAIAVALKRTMLNI